MLFNDRYLFISCIYYFVVLATGVCVYYLITDIYLSLVFTIVVFATGMCVYYLTLSTLSVADLSTRYILLHIS